MPIQYALFENHLTSALDDYAARVETTGSADLDAVIARILEQGSSATEGDILLILTDAIQAVESILLEGGRVNFGGLVELFPRIRGTFDGPTDSFDPARHRVDVGASPGHRVRQAVRSSATVEKIEAHKPAPSLIEYVDFGSETADAAITPGNIGIIDGHRLKFDPAQPDEGVFFIADAGGAETQIRMCQKNKPSQLVFLVPPGLPVGDYHLEVRARIRGGDTLRTGRLSATLTV